MCPRGSFKNRLCLLDTKPESTLSVMGPSRFSMLPHCPLTGIATDEKSAVTLLFVCTSLFSSRWLYGYIYIYKIFFFSTVDIWCYSLVDFKMFSLLLTLSPLTMMYLSTASPCFFFLGFLELLGSLRLWFSIHLGNFQLLRLQICLFVLFLLSLSFLLGIQITRLSGHLRFSDNLWFLHSSLCFILGSFHSVH